MRYENRYFELFILIEVKNSRRVKNYSFHLGQVYLGYKGILKSVLESNYNYCETPNKFNNLET